MQEGDLTSEVRGDVEAEDKVLVLRRVRVSYDLRIAPDQHVTAERVHGFHAQYCPVARSLAGAVECTTELRFRSDAGD